MINAEINTCGSWSKYSNLCDIGISIGETREIQNLCGMAFVTDIEESENYTQLGIKFNNYEEFKVFKSLINNVEEKYLTIKKNMEVL